MELPVAGIPSSHSLARVATIGVVTKHSGERSKYDEALRHLLQTSHGHDMFSWLKREVDELYLINQDFSEGIRSGAVTARRQCRFYNSPSSLGSHNESPGT